MAPNILQPLQPMPNGVPLRTLVLLVAIVLGLIAAWRLADILLLVFAAIVVATSLRAAAEALHRYVHVPVRLAVVTISIVVLFGGSLAIVLFGANIRSDLAELVARLPGMIDAVGSTLHVPDLFQRLIVPLQQFLLGEPLLGRVASYTSNALSSAAMLLLVLMASIYLAMDPDLYRRGFLHLVPPAHRTIAGKVLDDARTSLRHWLIGQTLIALYIGVTTGVVFWLLGLPYAGALGLIAGALEFVPYIGGLLASVPALLVALSTGDPWMLLWVAIACLVIQQLEGNLISPLIQQWAVRLPPVLGLFAMIALGTMFGPLGVLLAIPLTVVTIVVFKHLYATLLLRNGPTSEQPAAPVEASTAEAAE